VASKDLLNRETHKAVLSTEGVKGQGKRGWSQEEISGIVYNMSEKSRILVVEDEPDHLQAIKMILEREGGFEVVAAADAREGDEMLAKHDIDLILLDIALPGESGLDFCRRIKGEEENRDLPVIALSAYPDSIWRERSLEAGCVDYISKPSEPKIIVEILRQYLPG
jgi:CheY-like chemotaxis protein